eukprot:TRINITY_DN4321_c0_g1_i1.p1 TRINITY_DN4321_c0_g1~~TRINITY_DN4321_c0_g1_i1.p1  ORF type:complete len:407 (-),score=103.90 TRINITY_DN4321_c0_g1_i1:183-1322(-)
MKGVIVLLVVSLFCVFETNAQLGGGGPKTFSGKAGNALLINHGTSVKLPFDLSAYLANSFTFEAWINLIEAADGTYKPIVSRTPGSSNMYADFLLMVNVQGVLVFFMGNGAPSTYGVIMTADKIPSGKWVHVGFSIYTEDWQNNPSKITIYVDGKPYQETWVAGNRQFRPDRAVYIGSYTNENTHFFNGWIDEIRFWDEYRAPALFAAQRRFLVKPGASGLRANYRCNRPDTKLLRDDGPSQFHGQIVKNSGEGVRWGRSDVKIHLTTVLDLGQTDTLSLHPGDAPLPLTNVTYYIESIPSAGTLIDAVLRTPLNVSALPVAVSDPVVMFQAPSMPVITHFRYFAVEKKEGNIHKRLESVSTEFWIKVGDPAMCSECHC